MSPLALPIAALLGPYLAAFLNALLPSLGRPLLLACSLSSAGLGLKAILSSSPQLLAWLGPLGVQLAIDPLAGWFLLLDGLVFGAVVLDGWSRPQRASQLTLMLVLLGGLGGAAVVTDLISLYVTLEVISIAAFLLILSETDTNLWIGLRYLLIGNTAMTLYLVGAALLYAQTESFGLSEAAALPLCAGHVFLLIGLFTKGGLFLNGFWLPATHAAAAAPISALLSGSVVTAGVIPLVRFSLLNEALALRIGTVGLASALLGVIAGLICTDVKRLLAWSTLSQMGLLVLMPASAGLFGLAHGLAKAALFLSCRQLPTRALDHWNLGHCRPDQRLAFWLAPLSLAGLPPLIGSLAKTGTPSLAGPWLAPPAQPDRDSGDRGVRPSLEPGRNNACTWRSDPSDRRRRPGVVGGSGAAAGAVMAAPAPARLPHLPAVALQVALARREPGGRPAAPSTAAAKTPGSNRRSQHRPSFCA